MGLCSFPMATQASFFPGSDSGELNSQPLTLQIRYYTAELSSQTFISKGEVNYICRGELKKEENIKCSSYPKIVSFE